MFRILSGSTRPGFVSAVIVLGVAGATAVASGVLAPPAAADPAAITAGPFAIVPMLQLEQRYDDNIFSQPDSEVDSWVTVLKPSVTALADTGPRRLLLSYLNSTGLYSESSDDDFNDNRLGADYRWELNSHHQLGFTAAYADGHEDRGTGYSQGFNAFAIDEPDTFTQKTAGLAYDLGSDSSRGRMQLAVQHMEKEYTNHPATTLQRDRDDLNAVARFLWRLGGRSDLVAEVRQTEADYAFAPASVTGVLDTLDSTANKYYVGLDWEATAKTEGSLRLGRATKDFDDRDRKDFSGSSWEAEVRWLPRTYSVFSLNTLRDTRENNGTGNFIDSEAYRVGWEHEWSERISTHIFYALDNEVYEGDTAGREDDTATTGMRIDYAMRRWLGLGLSLNNIDRDSNVDTFVYERQQIVLHVQLSL